MTDKKFLSWNQVEWAKIMIFLLTPLITITLAWATTNNKIDSNTGAIGRNETRILKVEDTLEGIDSVVADIRTDLKIIQRDITYIKENIGELKDD